MENKRIKVKHHAHIEGNYSNGKTVKYYNVP